MLLSFVIACYKSENTIENVVEEIENIIKQKDGCAYEIVLVNDASPDGVIKKLTLLADRNSNVKVIDLAKNVGKANAILAGLANIKGDLVVFMDDDGQCPVDQLWKLVDAVENGYDLAYAAYPHKKQSFIKNFGSKVNTRVSSWLLEQPREIISSNFSVRRRFVCDEMIKYSGPFSNLRVLTLQSTQNIAMIPMEERERQYGKTGYTFIKLVRLMLNGCISFSIKPLRMAFLSGMIFILAGIAGGIFGLVKMSHSVPGYELLITIGIIGIIGGILMIQQGLLGEYLGRINVTVNNRPQYVVRKKINIDEQK